MGSKLSAIRHSVFKPESSSEDSESDRPQSPSQQQEHQSQRVDSSSSTFLLTGRVMSEGQIRTYRVVKAPMSSFNGPNDFRKYVDDEIFGQSRRLWYLEFENMQVFDDWVITLTSTYYEYGISFTKLQIDMSRVDACLDEDGRLHFAGSAGGRMEGRVMVQMPRKAYIWWSLHGEGEDRVFKDEDWPSLFNAGVTSTAEPAPDPPIAAQRLRPARQSFEAHMSIPPESGYSHLPPRGGGGHARLNPSSHHICQQVSRYLTYDDINGGSHRVEVPNRQYLQATDFFQFVNGCIFKGRETVQFSTDLGGFIHWIQRAGFRWISFTRLEIRVRDISMEKMEGGIHFGDILNNAAVICGGVVPKFNLNWSENILDYYREMWNYHPAEEEELVNDFDYLGNRGRIARIISNEHWLDIEHRADSFKAAPSFPIPLPHPRSARQTGRPSSRRDGSFTIHL